MQAGAPVLESRRAVSGGATATRAASAGGDALPRRAPCTPDTHQPKHTATDGRMGALPCYAPSTPMHAHTALTGRHSLIRLYIQERCCPGTATQTRTIACTHLHTYYGAHKHGMQALARATPRGRPRHLHCSSPRCWRRAVAASAPPQHARSRRHSASWSSRAGEQACGQRRGHSDKSGLGRRRRSPAQGTLHSGHAPAQAHCHRCSHGRPIWRAGVRSAHDLQLKSVL